MLSNILNLCADIGKITSLGRKKPGTSDLFRGRPRQRRREYVTGVKPTWGTGGKGLKKKSGRFCAQFCKCFCTPGIGAEPAGRKGTFPAS